MFTLNPYKLSWINSSLFLIFLVWFIKYKPKFQKAILLLSILPVLSFFRNTDFNGGMVQNSAFLAGFYQNLQESNPIPRWAERVDTNFGYPIYLFIYPLPFYLGSIFHFFGASFVDSGKLVFVTTYVLSGIWMWKWVSSKFNHWPAFAATIAYLFAPYRFINMHLRLDIGESVAVAILPLLFFYIDKNNLTGIALLSFLLILAHPATSICGLVLAASYIAVKQNWRQIGLILLGVLMSSYYWVPIIAESKYANVDAFTQNVEFFPWYEYIFSPYRWGLLYQGGEGKMVFPIGYTLMVVTILSLLRIHKLNKRIKFWLAAFLGIVFLLLPQSEFVWENFPLINKFQFSYRILGIMTIITAMITGYFFQNVHRFIKLWIIIFLIFTVGTTILNWGNREYRNYSMPDFELKRLLSIQSQMWGTGFPQALPRWNKFSNLWGPEKIAGPIEILKGTGKIEPLTRTSNRHEYNIWANTDMRLKENTFYYPGWKLYINGSEAPINYENTQDAGIMEFEVKKGENKVKLIFGETKIRKMGIIISIISFIISIVVLL